MHTTREGSGPVATSTKSRLTGERPQQGVTPDSLLALHEAGYRAVLERIGSGRILDVGCGQGFESARFLAPDRTVLGVDYSADATTTAAARYEPEGLKVAQMDARDLGLQTGTFDGACSSHLIEHFTDPERHMAVSSPTTACSASSPPTDRPTSRTPSTSICSTAPSSRQCSTGTSKTCGSAVSTPNHT
jgi:trans-aconitate methyltransferase